MKIIRDIRLYRCEQLNVHGFPSLEDFADRALTASVYRIAMKLREQGFSMGEFDHLYLVFTPGPSEGKIRLSEKVDRYHPWYRICFVQVSEDSYAHLHEAEYAASVMEALRNALITLFTSESFPEAQICSCIQQALEQGEGMLIRFKEKQTTRRRAQVLLRYRDTCRYWPLLRVYDAEGELLLEQELPEALTLDAYGDILLSSSKITIRPRRNAFTEDMEAMTFEY